MPHDFKLSLFGLKLIKAYEGFRPAETTLVSGQRVIGFGHRYTPDEEPMVSREKAEKILKTDLQPYVAMVNESIFAPLTQSQFDALVSLSYNIGPRAFLASSVIHGLNNGRPLEAAAGFDQWCRSKVNGKIYVVDALVRRRTAEKALFLRPVTGIVAAPRNEIPPRKTAIVQNEPEIPVYGRTDEHGIVQRAPYDAASVDADMANEDFPHMRRDDGPAGILTLSELAPSEDEVEPQAGARSTHTELDIPLENEEGLSPIALAAAEVSERLERLIENRTDTAIAPEPAPKPAATVRERSILELTADKIERSVPVPANDGAHPDYRRPGRHKPVSARTPDAFIAYSEPETEVEETPGLGAFWTAFLVGAVMFGAGFVKWFLNPDADQQSLSAFLAPVGTIVGAMVALGAIYYLIKTMAKRN